MVIDGRNVMSLSNGMRLGSTQVDTIMSCIHLVRVPDGFLYVGQYPPNGLGFFKQFACARDGIPFAFSAFPDTVRLVL